LLRFGGRRVTSVLGFFFAVILACNRSDLYFYVYYVANIVAGIFCGANMHCLCHAYVVKKLKITNCKSRNHLVYCRKAL